jgi:tRNA(fMet)-specific endonuclease VapC
MKYMLDTNIFSHMVNNNTAVLQAYAKVASDDTSLSVISHGEILFGIQKQIPSASKLLRIRYLLEQIPIALLADTVAAHYAKIRAELEVAGQPISPNDTWIAAHSLSLGATLVTNNVREFKRVKGLKVENWAS